MVYDFDGTLSPQSMQNYTVLPKIGTKPSDFWRLVEQEAKATRSDKMLVYMRLILEKAEEKKVRITKEDFKTLASKIKFFPGVEDWFERMNGFVKSEGEQKILIKHYLISGGNKEILDGVKMARHFENIYASEYHFNHNGVAVFPKILVTDTTKTQFLFRINKGREDVAETINDHMPEAQRPIPFSNMIYIGDGLTDVPCMALTKKSGGHTIAVYQKGSSKGLGVCKTLLHANRADFIAPADYRKGSDLSRRVQILLRSIITQIQFQREVFECQRRHARVKH